MVLFVRERPAKAAVPVRLDLQADRFPRRYWNYFGVTALFGIGNSSNAFLILRTTDLGVSLTATIVIYAVYNLVAALASFPAGYLSDHFGRKGVLMLAFVVFLIVYAGFGVATNRLARRPVRALRYLPGHLPGGGQDVRDRFGPAGLAGERRRLVFGDDRRHGADRQHRRRSVLDGRQPVGHVFLGGRFGAARERRARPARAAEPIESVRNAGDRAMTFLRRILATDAPAAVILVRLTVGGVFLSEGVQKFRFPAELGLGRFAKIGIPSPQVMAPFVGVCEVVCGSLFLLGLFTRLAAVPMIIDMLVAISTTKVPMLLKNGFWAMAHEARVDYAMLLGSIFLLIVGAGRWSVDVKLVGQQGGSTR